MNNYQNSPQVDITEDELAQVIASSIYAFCAAKYRKELSVLEVRAAYEATRETIQECPSQRDFINNFCQVYQEKIES